MKDGLDITEAEWEVMAVLWDSSPRTGNDVISALQPVKGWQPNTVRTLLARLAAKKAVHVDRKGKELSYRPAVDREECRRREVRSLAQRLYGGALRPILMQFMGDADLSREDIAELRRMLDEKERKK